MWGAIVSSYFMGFITTLFFVPRLGDVYGRKNIIMISLVTNLTASILMLATSSLRVFYACMFINGASLSGRLSVGVVYMQELMPSKYRVLAGTLFSALQSLCAILGVFYFSVVSTNAFSFIVCCPIFLALSIVIYLGLPESPLYLL